MIKFVTGLIGTLMMIVFLGYYAISLNAIPLWVIIVSVLAMVAWQFIETLKSGDGTSGQP